MGSKPLKSRRRCLACGAVKAIESFDPHNSQQRYKVCQDCRAEGLRAVESGGAYEVECDDCGERFRTEHPWMLECEPCYEFRSTSKIARVA